MMMKCFPRLPSVGARLAQHFSLHNDWGDKARCLLCPPIIYVKEKNVCRSSCANENFASRFPILKSSKLF